MPTRRIAGQLGLDPKNGRRYLTAASTAGVRVTATISDEEVRQVLLALHPSSGRPRGDGWVRCLEQRTTIERWLGDGLWILRGSRDGRNDYADLAARRRPLLVRLGWSTFRCSQ